MGSGDDSPEEAAAIEREFGEASEVEQQFDEVADEE
jgi:hypothetical protein